MHANISLKNDDLSDASIVTRTFKPGETFNYKLTIKNNTVEAVDILDGQVNGLDLDCLRRLCILSMPVS